MNRKSLSGPDDMWEWLPWDNGFVGMGLAVREAGWFLIWLFFSGSPGRVINSGRVRKKRWGEVRNRGGKRGREKKRKTETERDQDIEKERETLFSFVSSLLTWMEFTDPRPNQQVLSGSSWCPSTSPSQSSSLLRSFSSGPCPDRSPSSLLSLGWTRPLWSYRI